MKHSQIFCIYFSIIILNGCSWVTRDYIYIPSGKTDWNYYAITGEQKSVKDVPTPDKAILIYDRQNIKIQVHSGYTHTVTTGPCCFPVIPHLWASSENKILTLTMIIKSKIKPINLDFSRIQLYINDESKSIYYTLSNIIYLSNGKKYENKINLNAYPEFKINADSEMEFLIKIIKNVNNINSINIQIEGVRIDENPINIPNLLLIKKKGTINYDEWTL